MFTIVMSLWSVVVNSSASLACLSCDLFLPLTPVQRPPLVGVEPGTMRASVIEAVQYSWRLGRVASHVSWIRTTSALVSSVYPSRIASLCGLREPAFHDRTTSGSWGVAGSESCCLEVLGICGVLWVNRFLRSIHSDVPVFLSDLARSLASFRDKNLVACSMVVGLLRISERIPLRLVSRFLRL